MFTESAALALSTLATLAVGVPQKPATKDYKIGLQVYGYNGDPSAYKEWYASINKLAVREGRSESKATHIQFGGPVYNVDVNAVKCRAYGDVEGSIPIGGTFDINHVLDLGGDPVGMYSILCYIVGEDEKA
ncbi:hypothetical protein CLAFUW4_00002 [Fulvia fulva]|uniref:Uncharacterized protein n=1 Tax=Passalora fulva TaxID=5499 RepID=A0A9Q8P3B7_PASFU|nr:uncharacterized protein CLAFUR5_00001 [Fulvia fulva]KAK4635404.1 hypothetical protein CLAFUR4_00002 [Fulvia fulva]KAK4638025.1 hypothetical protein CLAFUR0_00002 [Fulvia fulva]UJO11624.1 hypothetical protein CLAFUR5_00001 [Fulvia fulva]WPV09659.1 hypothetical protein CLAFUW4_00002 [Fulvia fulva]WPV23577.1 hypothetical protein CLAFUW7_00002 [Fulvia fulva]